MDEVDDILERRGDNQYECPNDKPFEFQISNWWSEDMDDSFVIRIFGTDEKGRSVHVRVDNFTPYFFVEIPEHWSKMQIEALKSWFGEKYRNGFVGSQVIKRIKFFGFSGKKQYPFLKVLFNTQKTMRWAAKTLQTPIYLPVISRHKIQLDCYESKLEPLLRFMHLRKIEGSGWVRLNPGQFKENEEARTQFSIEAEWDVIEGIEKNAQAPRLVISFDLECDSCDGMFPQFKRHGDKIIQIGNTAHWYNHPDHPGVTPSEAKIVDQTIFVHPSSEPIPGVNVVNCRTEAELIEKWATYIEQIDPDDLTGYYIVGFDMEYIYKRAEMLGVTHVLEKLHRVFDVEGNYEEKKMSSSAYGENIYKMLKMTGRNRIDLMKYIAREYKLNSYKLDNVSKHFLGNKKEDLKYHLLFEKQHGTDADRAEIARYCIQDCKLCNHLMHKLDVLAATVGMSNVTKVPLEYLFVREQGVKVFSQVADKCTQKGYLIKTLQILPGEGRGYLGALVIDPDTGFYSEPVTVMDFSSLYPSIMISENISPDTKVTDKTFMDLEDYTYNHITHQTVGGVTKKCCFAVHKNGERGVMPDILETLLAARKATRAEIKKTDDPFMKKTLNYRQLGYKVSANSMYGALGAGTNAIYDPDCAASVTARGREHLDNARKVVLDNFKGSECVYGDTDSIFIKFPFPEDMPEREKIVRSIELGIKGANMVTVDLKPPMNLEYEKVLNRLVLITKKRYVGNLYEHDPDSYERKSMGLVTKRRDNADLTKKLYNGLLDIMLDGERSVIRQDVLKFINGFLRKLLNRGFPLEDLTISKSLGSNYVDPNAIVQARLAERMKERDPGNAPRVNDRVQYIFVVKGTPKDHKGMLQGDRVEPPEYIAENNLEIDVLSYIEHVKKPITQLLQLIVDDPATLFEPYEIEESMNRYNFAPLVHPLVCDDLQKSLQLGLKHVGNIPEVRTFFNDFEQVFYGGGEEVLEDSEEILERLTRHFDIFLKDYIRSGGELKSIKKALLPILDIHCENGKDMFKPYEIQAFNKSKGIRQLVYSSAPPAKRLQQNLGKITKFSPKTAKQLGAQTTLKWLKR